MDLATVFFAPDSAANRPGAFALRMFRNYDGNGGRFGERSVRATSGDPGKLAVYAAERRDGALTILVINKSPTVDYRTSVRIDGFTPAGDVETYRYGAALPGAISHEPSIPAATEIASVFPHYSITLYVVRRP
jgi:hypothetical protein